MPDTLFNPLVVLVLAVTSVECTNPPHIILLVADDLGWNDVSWNNADISTPNLKNLADNGVILNSSYVQNVCSPSRSSILTGIYPYHMGLQAGVVSKDSPQFMTTNYSTLAEELDLKGYSTHMIGKWHLGHCNWSYTPTYRGFDSHGGLLLGSGEHYAHTTGNGFDFRHNEAVDHSYDDIHSTDAFTDITVDIINNHNANTPLFLYVAYQAGHTPLDVEPAYWNMYSSINDENRRNFSGMITHLDYSVGQIWQALENNNLTDNLLLVFLSDNGGDVEHGGNNWPLRGSKGTNWEGGVRIPAFVHSPTLLNATGYTQSGMMHAVDWYATFLDVAGITPSAGIDGVSQWDMLSNGAVSARTEFVYNINSLDGTAAIRVGDYKLTQGKVGALSQIYTVPSKRRRRDVDEEEVVEEEEEEGHGRYERAVTKYRLYNIADDPYETTDLSKTMRPKTAAMKVILENYRLSEYPANVPAVDDASKPSNFGGNWSPGWCEGDL